jgi:hypothetical protein
MSSLLTVTRTSWSFSQQQAGRQCQRQQQNFIHRHPPVPAWHWVANEDKAIRQEQEDADE